MSGLAIESECYGCGACAASCPVHCIELVKDNKGFRYPRIDMDKCISCKNCPPQSINFL